MQTVTLKASIFRVIFGVVFIISFAILLNLWYAVGQHAKNQLRDDLKVSRSVLQQYLAAREKTLFDSASILTSDFGFRAAVTTKNIATIKSVLGNHGNRINADLMLLLSLEGETINHTQETNKKLVEFPYPDLINEVIAQGGTTSIVILDDSLFQVMMLIVEAPLPIAIAVIGFELDENSLLELKQITGLETAIEAMIGNKPILQHSTAKLECNNQILSKNAILILPSLFFNK
ncbi:MAG: GGDEF domain-containing protein, partial [Pseudomonadota bacterium]